MSQERGYYDFLQNPEWLEEGWELITPLFHQGVEVTLYKILKAHGEPIIIDHVKAEGQKEENYRIYAKSEKSWEIETIINILQKSPAYIALSEAETAHFEASTPAKNLYRQLFTPGNQLSEEERTLFDPDFEPSGKPLLFLPLPKSETIRKRIWAKATKKLAEVNTLFSSKEKVYEVLAEMAAPILSRGDESIQEQIKESLKKGSRRRIKIPKIRIPMKRILEITGLAAKPISKAEEFALLDNAYNQLMEKLGGREFFEQDEFGNFGLKSPELRSPPQIFTLESNDFTDPYLLVAEELEEREYKVKIFNLGFSTLVILKGEAKDVYSKIRSHPQIEKLIERKPFEHLSIEDGKNMLSLDQASLRRLIAEVTTQAISG